MGNPKQKPVYRTDLSSKEAYNACRHLLSRVQWELVSDNEYMCIGDGEKLNKVKLARVLTEFFPDSDVLVILDRRTFYSAKFESIIEKHEHDLLDHEVWICDRSFTKLIEFLPMGIARKGTLKNQK